MSIRVLFLSDLAFSAERRYLLEPWLGEMTRELRRLSGQGLKPDLVAILGDTVRSGRSGDLQFMEKWISRELLPAVGLEPQALLLVPGDRDLEPEKARDMVRDMHQALLEGGERAVESLMSNKDQLKVLLAPLQRWLAFAKRLTGQREPWTYKRHGKTGFACLATAWLSCGQEREDRGRLLLGRPQVQSLLKEIEGSEARVALAHHPLEDLHAVDGPARRDLLRGIEVLLRAHEGPTEALRKTAPGYDVVEIAAGPALCERGRTFGFLEIDEREIRVRPYVPGPSGFTPDRNNAPGVWVFPRRVGEKEPVPEIQQVEHREPEWPPRPWPLLSPYEHAATFGGRGAELSSLLDSLRQERLIWTVFAPSGAGKSSLVRAGLLPALRQVGIPGVQDPMPAMPGLAGRLLAGLIQGAPRVEDHDVESFVRWLGRIRDAFGHRPVLVLDQFEDVFHSPALELLGRLIRATELACGGRVCLWVLVYRQEYHGRVRAWLAATRVQGGVSRAFAGDLAGPEISVEWPLRLLGDPGGEPDPLERATKAFEEAILRPLDLRDELGRLRYPVTFAPGAARRLARAFARARLKPDSDALSPELQVVLARLLDEHGQKGEIQLPQADEDVDQYVSGAIGIHLRRKLDELAGDLTPAQAQDRKPEIRARRTLALLMLGQLQEDGRRVAVPVSTLVLEDSGRELLQALGGTRIWLLRQEWRGETLCATLPHDRIAAEVYKILNDPKEIVKYDLDRELAELWRLVTQRTVAWKGGEGDTGAVVLDSERVRLLRDRAVALPWDEARLRWWKAAQDAHRDQEVKELITKVRGGDVLSGEPLKMLHRLRVEFGLDGVALAGALACRGAFKPESRDEIFGMGFVGLKDEERVEILPALVEALAPCVDEAEKAESFYGVLIAAIEPVRRVDAGLGGRVREAVVLAMRARRRGLPVMDPDDGSWTPVIEGEFEVGCFSEEGESPFRYETLHAVRLSPYQMRRTATSIEEYRAFAGQHLRDKDWDASWPAIRVNWYEALAYAAWAGAELPSEAQWEVAARGGKSEDYRKTAYYNGNTEEDLSRVGLYAGNRSRVLGPTRMRPLCVGEQVKGCPPHHLGLVNIHGNVNEWCLDWYADYPQETEQDPQGPTVPPDPSSAARVVRGGSWNVSAVNARSAFRGWLLPADRDGGVGFRLVLPQPMGS